MEIPSFPHSKISPNTAIPMVAQCCYHGQSPPITTNHPPITSEIYDQSPSNHLPITSKLLLQARQITVQLPQQNTRLSLSSLFFSLPSFLLLSFLPPLPYAQMALYKILFYRLWTAPSILNEKKGKEALVINDIWRNIFSIFCKNVLQVFFRELCLRPLCKSYSSKLGLTIY